MKFILSLSLLLSCLIAFPQESTLYNPDADAAKDIKAAVKKAAAENKFVLIRK